MNGYEWHGVWVFAEQREGSLHDVSLELLSKARELAVEDGEQVTAVVFGDRVEDLASTLSAYGADTILVAEDPRLKDYRVVPYTILLESLVREHRPNILLMGATALGVELAPRVAARLETGLSAHCIDLRLDSEGALLQVVPGWEGGVVATISCPNHRPQMATVMPGAMRVSPPRERPAVIERVEVVLSDIDLGPEVLRVVRDEPQEQPLEKAEVIVAGGWGLGSLENWRLIEELASVLGGAVGASRPPVDEGWVSEDRMIGQSGKTVRPNLYIGVGISGVMHHIVGMDQSRTIIAVNNDPNAEIFRTSDVIVVEDFRKILPKLTDELRARREKGYVDPTCVVSE